METTDPFDAGSLEQFQKATVAATLEDLAGPGDWLSAAERLAVLNETRAAQRNELDRQRKLALSPEMVDGHHQSTGVLQAAEVELVHRLGTDPGRLRRTWADDIIGEISEERYTEIVGVVAIGRVLDRFAEALGEPYAGFGAPREGDVAGVRPDGVGDVGAWVSQTIEKTRANVSRALSLVPETNATWRRLVNDFYSHDDGFFDLDWHRPLSRLQTELVAARTTVLNECFY